MHKIELEKIFGRLILVVQSRKNSQIEMFLGGINLKKNLGGFSTAQKFLGDGTNTKRSLQLTTKK